MLASRSGPCLRVAVAANEPFAALTKVEAITASQSLLPIAQDLRPSG
jgi:hypothetical protein